VRSLCGLSLLLVPCALAAQIPPSAARAVSVITPADVQHRIALLADDSMMGRATPSPQLEQAARYIAGEFERFGLKPGGEGGTYFQRYPLSSLHVDFGSSTIRVAGAANATWRVGSDALHYRGSVPATGVSGPLVLVTGLFADSARPDSAVLNGKVVVFAEVGGARTLQQVLGRTRPAAVLSAVAWPEPAWQREAAAQVRPRMRYAAREAASPPVLLVRRSAVLALLAQAGVVLDTATARDEPFRVVPLPTLTARVQVQQRGQAQLSAPNVIGILWGRDPVLKHEFVFFTAHMDHLGTPGAGEGCVAKGADSICNGADDDASGTTAVLEAAQALSHLSPRPQRSLVFMTVSGEERGLWGSSYFVDHPTVALTRVVADLNTDMIGRNWKDTIAAIGKEQSDLGATLDRVAAAHPELRLTPIGDIWPMEAFYFRSDHYNFARKGVPILFFFSGTHPDYHEVSDSPDKIDAEKAARIIKLLCYVGLDVANAPERPKWNPDSYRRVVQGAP
jgi:hypothetical protein